MIRVLVADDQRFNRVLLTRCLDPDRYVVQEAENGEEALALFDAERPDVVLLDVMMPELDGFATARAMKARQGDDYVPIIMVTSLADEDSLREGMEAGADDFVPKPFNRIVLESKLNACLRTRALFQTLASKNEELRGLHEQSHREQVMAEKLMAEILRSPALEHPMFRFRTRPMDVFNGDLLLAGEGPGGRMRLLLGDFAGHGLAAAIGGLPVVVRFEDVCRQAESLAEVASVANAQLREVLSRDRFLAATLMDFDAVGQRLDILNLGMPPALLRRRDGDVEAVASSFLPLGVLDDFDAAEAVRQLAVEPGDRLYLYSDGVTEAEDETGAVFGEDRLVQILTRAPHPDACFGAVLDELDGFLRGAAAGDDVTFMEVDPARLRARDVVDGGGSDVAESSRAAQVSLRLTPPVLRGGDPLAMLASALESFGLLEGRRAEVFAVVAELVNNAVDHGLLGLDSKLKADAEGFATFYEERARRIAEAEDGYVDVTLDVEPLEAGCVIRVTVEDSGAGFDVAALDGESDGELHGRGLSMVRELCESLRYSERGNRVEAVFRAAA